MASAQVSSKSMISQEHLEAGRRRLEEFRKKKGAKKSVSTSQPRTSNSTTSENQASEHEPVPVDSVGPANRMTVGVTPASGLPGYSGIKHGFPHDSGTETVPQLQINFQSSNSNSPDFLPAIPKRVGSETDIGDGKHDVATSLGRRGSLQDGRLYSEGQFSNLLHQHHHDESESVRPNIDFQASNLEHGHNQRGLTSKNYLSSNIDEKRPNGAVGRFFEYGSQRESEPLSGGLNFNATVTESYSRRFHPSFLDSPNINKDSPTHTQSLTGKKEKFATSKIPTSSWVQDSATPTPMSSNTNSDYFVNGFRGQTMLENSTESNFEFRLERRTEDFSALEQHIEDLTQEKFSLQRAMEASKALAESLATENSSLTESYNQQASIVSQLKAEMERLQEEIKARLVELEAIKAEFTNTHLECNAADERAKLLASEVINLEEKALRLRSNELKLERELENSNAGITSCKKKLSSLEKERRDLQQTVEALLEEKKMLQSKLHKASTSGISIDTYKGYAKKDASTSTNDLRNNSEQISSHIQMHDDTDNLLSLLENTYSRVEDVAMIIPPDQVQVIQNINSLISEIISEKEEVMQALINEVSTSAKLKDLNKELSHKLEAQTQRLELLTAQSMASEKPPVRQPMGSQIVRETVSYADEGDEVVERVLGWIMKLFPGGPSKRRTSRL